MKQGFSPSTQLIKRDGETNVVDGDDDVGSWGHLGVCACGEEMGGGGGE